MRPHVILSALLAWLAAAVAGHAQDRYYLLVFGSQSEPKKARYTHTWGTFVRVPCTGGPLEVNTISWLPATLVIRPLALFSEPGVNLDLYSTITYARSNCERISVWGPYEISCQLYQRGLERRAGLENGEYKYKAIDFFVYGPSASDCIHSVTDLDERPLRLHVSEIFRNGQQAAHYCVRRLARAGEIIGGSEAKHEWLYEAMGLCNQPLIRREYSGRFWFWP